ncbi:MAG: tail fiber domain-containing protein [Phycisphaerales bacterium]
MLRKTFVGMAAALALCAGSASVMAQGTGITYQGQLKNSGAAVNSATDKQFSLWTMAAGGFAGQALKNGGGAWAVLSDARAKHDIAPLTGALDKLSQLQGRTYFYNNPKTVGPGEGQCTGFVAQEVEEVFPEWIGTLADGTKTLSITGFEALTVESLKTLRAEKDAQIARVKADNEALKARLEKIEALLAAQAAK